MTSYITHFVISINLTIFCTAFPSYGHGKMESIPGHLGHRVGDTVDGEPTHHRTHSHTHLHTEDNLEMPNYPTIHVFGQMEELEVKPRRKCKPHAQRWE